MRLGSATAFVAEASLWVAGAALVAGAAGADLSVAGVGLSGLGGATPSPVASGNVQTLAPGASPTISPIVSKYQAYVARPDYQIKVKYTSTQSFPYNGETYELDMSGTASYKAGDLAQSQRVATNKGIVTTYDEVELGSFNYESVNGGPWKKTARDPGSAQANKLMFAPPLPFVDKGVEWKNGRQLHRLEIADQVAYSKAMQQARSGPTDAQFVCMVWVTDDGVPALIKIEGWMQGPFQSASVKFTLTYEFRVIATSGVTIKAPI